MARAPARARAFLCPGWPMFFRVIWWNSWLIGNFQPCPYASSYSVPMASSAAPSPTHAILKKKDWEVYGMDVGDHKLGDCLGNPRFKFVEGDITISKEWIEYHVKKCDAVLPLVALIANSGAGEYVKDPLSGLRVGFRRPTWTSCASAQSTGSASSSRRPPRSTACAPDKELDEETRASLVLRPGH